MQDYRLLSAPSRCVYPSLTAAFTLSMQAWSSWLCSCFLYHAVPVPYASIGIDVPSFSFNQGIGVWILAIFVVAFEMLHGIDEGVGGWSTDVRLVAQYMNKHPAFLTYVVVRIARRYRQTGSVLACLKKPKGAFHVLINHFGMPRGAPWVR